LSDQVNNGIESILARVTALEEAGKAEAQTLMDKVHAELWQWGSHLRNVGIGSVTLSIALYIVKNLL